MPALPPDPLPVSPDEPRRAGLLPSSPESWLFLAAGVAVLGYGAYLIITTLAATGRGHILGSVLAAFGLSLMPWRAVAILGSAGLLGIGLWMFINNYSTVQALVITVVGVLGIAERLRRGRGVA